LKTSAELFDERIKSDEVYSKNEKERQMNEEEKLEQAQLFAKDIKEEAIEKRIKYIMDDEKDIPNIKELTLRD